MTMQNYSVSLNVTTVEECKSYYRDSGGKLSPLLNKLLEDWLKLQKKSKRKPISEDKTKKKDDLFGSDLDLLGDENIK